MKKILTFVTAVVLSVAILVSMTSCDQIGAMLDSARDLETTQENEETTTGTSETTEATTIDPSLEPLTYPDHVYTVEEIHPEHTPGRTEGEEASQLLATLETDYLHYSMTSYVDVEVYFDNPEALDFVNVEPTWGEIDLDVSDACDYYCAIRDSLLTINYETLSEDDRIFFDKFLYDVEENIYMSSFTCFTYMKAIFSDLNGPQTELMLVLKVLQFDTIEDAENYIALIADIDNYYDQICEFEELRAAYGYASSDEQYENVAVTFDNLLAMEDTCFLYDSFAERLDNIEGITEDEKAELIDTHNEAMHEYFFPEFEECAQRMRDLIGSGGVATGLCNYEGGAAYYDALFRNCSNSNESIEDATSSLEAITASLYTSYLTIMTNSSSGGELPSDFYIDMSAGDMEQNLTLLEEAITADFPSIPEHSYSLMDVPEELAQDMSPAAYLGYHIDTLDGNLIINNPATVSANFGLVCAHEGYPGHMYQSLYTRSNTSHYYMLIFDSIGYSEGWAQYVQCYSSRYFTDNELLLDATAISEVINVLIMARLEIGIHNEGWDVQDCADYFAELTGTEISADALAPDYEMLVSIPGYSIPYAMGYIHTMSIISQAHTAFPDATDLEIHTAYLECLTGTYEQIQERMTETLTNS